jgi:serine/threonine-protein kinase
MIVLALCALLALASAWMYVSVERSLRELRGQGLPALLEAKTKSLEVFIAERRADGERWARDPEIAALTVTLARLARSRDIASHCAGEEVALWRTRVSAMMQAESAPAVNAVDREGLVIASTIDETCGLSAQPRIRAPQLAQVFSGRTQFIRPFAADPRLVAAQPFLGSRALAWVETPVRDEAGSVVAALGIASFVARDFEDILTAARPGETGEAYAFDENGTLLSEIRDRRGLQRSGILPKDPAGGSFGLQLRDPGLELDASTQPEGSASEWPFTRAVAAALTAAAVTAKNAPLDGVLLDPYRNYRGAEVIGAWRWLPEERMGIVAEMGVDEAYAPLRYVRATMAVVLVLLVGTAGWAAWTTLALARANARPAQGRRIGAYRLEAELAEGGMANVYLARHALLKRPTAIKIMKRHMATDELAARFEREVRLVSELTHPNTVEIYDYGHTPDGLLYYAMEYVEGITLDALVAEHGALALGRMRYIVLQVCDALAEVHRRRMVHRDIKPQNVMLCERGGVGDFVKLIDFGIVKRIEAVAGDYSDAQRALTRQVRLLGTPSYMAPERIGAPEGVDPRADVYGVGALVYFLVTGRPPFDGETEADILRDVLAVEAPQLAAALPFVPPALDEIVARCLAKKPQMRPGAIGEIAAVLSSLDVEPWTREDASAWWDAHLARVRGSRTARTAP